MPGTPPRTPWVPARGASSSPVAGRLRTVLGAGAGGSWPQRRLCRSRPIGRGSRARVLGQCHRDTTRWLQCGTQAASPAWAVPPSSREALRHFGLRPCKPGWAPEGGSPGRRGQPGQEGHQPARPMADQPHTQAWRGTSYLCFIPYSPNFPGFQGPGNLLWPPASPREILRHEWVKQQSEPSVVWSLWASWWHLGGGRGWLLDVECGMGWKVAGPEPHTCRKSPSGGRACVWQACLPDAVWLAVGSGVLPKGSH